MPFDPDQYLKNKGGGFDPDDFLTRKQAPQPAPDRSFMEETARKAEYASRGAVASLLELVGAVPDLTAAGLRAIGLPAPEDPNFYTDKLKGGFQTAGEAISAPLQAALPGAMQGPVSTGDKVAYGAGRGAADAASMIVPAAMIGKTAKAGGMAQGLAKTLAAQPVTQMAAGATGGAVGQATGNPYLGLAASVATPMAMGGAGRLLTPVRNSLSRNERQLAKAAEAMGIKLTPGQATGSKPLQTAESVMADLPFTSGKQHRLYDAQRAAFNKAVLAKAGIKSDNAAPEVIDGAFKALGRQFDDLAAITRVNIDPQFHDDVARVVQDYGRRLPRDVKTVFKSYMDDIRQMEKAAAQPGVTNIEIDGGTYKNIASDIRRAARGARNTPDLQRALNGLSSALDDALGRSASPDLSAAWAGVRRKYRNLLTIDGAMAGGTQASRAAGDIPLGGLRQAVKSADRSGFARGRGDLNEVARVGDFLAGKIPNSGTQPRTFMQGLLTGAPLTGGLAAHSVLGVDPVIAAAGAGTTIALPKLAQTLMNSQAGQAWLRNQLVKGSGPMSKELLAKILAAQSRGPLVDNLLAQSAANQ